MSTSACTSFPPSCLAYWFVYTTGDKAAIGRAIQAQIQSVDASLPVSNIAEMTEVVSSGVGDRRFGASLLAIFAALALLLTSVGIYGVTSYSIARRTKEFGSSRSALGASREEIVRMVLLGGMRPIIAGMLVGGAGAALSGRLIAALLYGVGSTDVAIYTVAGIAVVLVGVAANYIPARRAARVEPIIALREE